MTGFFISVVCFILSYVIGVHLLGNYVTGNPYWGVVIFFFWVSIVAIIFSPIIIENTLQKLMIDKKIESQNLFIFTIGLVFTVSSLLLIEIYLLFPPNEFGLLIAYSHSKLENLILGFLLIIVNALNRKYKIRLLKKKKTHRR